MLLTFERVEEFKYLGTTLTNQNSIPEENKSRMRSGNACYHSVQNLLSSRLLSKNLKIKIYLLTSWCRVLPEQLTGLKLVKKFPAFHGTRRFITALTSVRHLFLSWASPIQSTYPPPTSHLLEIHPNIIHPSTPRSP